MSCKCVETGEFPIKIIQGDSYRRVYQFYDADNNLLTNDVIASVLLSVPRLTYTQILNWDDEEQGYVFILSAETTADFPYCKGTYDVTLTFIDDQVSTQVYQSSWQIFNKDTFYNTITNNSGCLTADKSRVVIKTGIMVGAGGGGTNDHRLLNHRDADDQHPISAITGLQDELDGKQPIGDYATTQEVDELANIVDGKADRDEIPTKTSELQNDSGFITSIPSEYVTDTELNTAIQGVRSDIPTKVSDLTNDSNFATEGYVDNIDTNLQGQIDDLQAEKMPIMTIDTTPIEGSTNLVESGGVYDAIDGVQQDVDNINSLIPSQATTTNKLVSASEMGDAISSVEAKQLYATASQGSFATKAQLLSATTYYNADGTIATPTKNDVAYVLSDESHDNKSAKYVIADITQSGIVWGFVITFSDVTFTQTQMDSINSGVTQQKVSAYDSHIVDKTNPHEVTYQQLGGTNPSYTKSETDNLLNSKQNVITDLATIRSGAVLGATAVQPETLDNYALKDDLNDYALKTNLPINVKDYGAKGDGETDDTEAIQAALEAGRHIVIPDGTYMINVDDDGGLRPQSNSVITLSPNAVLKCFTADTDYYSIVHIDNVSNVVMQGGKIVGDKATHIAIETATYEFGYGILVDNSENITLRNIEIVDCIGDGVNVGVEGNEHILLDNLIIHDCRRQGISVISGNNILIKNCEIYNINGTLPKSGIDIEPDGTREVSNVTISDCYIHDTDGASIIVAETVNSITNVSINGGALEYVQFAGGNNLLMANATVGKVTIGSEDAVMINNCNISEIWLNCGNAVFSACKFESHDVKDYFIRVLFDRLSTSKSEKIAFNGCTFDVTNCKHFLFSPFGGASSGIELLEFNNCSASITHNLTSTFATSGFSNRMPHRTVINGSQFVFNSKIYQLFTADALSAENVELVIIDSTIINANEYRTNYVISGTNTYAVWIENSRIVNYINMLYEDGAGDGEIVLLNNTLEMYHPTGKYPTTSDVNIVNVTRDNTKYLDGVTSNVQEQLGEKQKTAITATVTIAVADWEGGTTVVKNVTGVTATNIVFCDSSDPDVQCTAQGAGTLTFTAGATLTAEVTVKVVILP